MERYDHILGANCHLFDLVGIRDIRNYSSDHFAIWPRLLQRPMRCPSRCLWGRHKFPLSLPAAANLSVPDTKFQALRSLDLPPLPPLTRFPRPLWIPLATIKMICERAGLNINPCHHWNVARDLKKAVRGSILEDSQRQAEKAAAEIGACIDLETGDTDLCRACTVLNRWYRHASARAPNHSWADMVMVTKDYATLYQWEEPDPPG